MPARTEVGVKHQYGTKVTAKTFMLSEISYSIGTGTFVEVFFNFFLSHASVNLRCLTANLKALTDNLLLLSSRMSAEDVGFNCERSVQRVVKFPYLSTGRSIRHSPSRKVKV